MAGQRASRTRTNVLHKAETARRLLAPIQPHDDPLHAPNLREQLVYLGLGRVEGEVADVQRLREGKSGFLRLQGDELFAVPIDLRRGLARRVQLLSRETNFKISLRY
jgi:hypothetical protein